MAVREKVELREVFEGVCGVLRKYGKGMDLLDYLPGSTAKEKKRMLVMYGKKEVSVFKKPPQKMYVAGAVLQKGYVALHFLPIYCAPRQIEVSPGMKKRLKGKACFHLKQWDKETAREVEALLKQGVACFRGMGWI